LDRLDGKTALVTGSTDGVGRYVAKALGAAGARVLVHGRDEKRGEDVVGEIAASGGSATFVRADFSSFADVRRLAGQVAAEADRLDILINNAGIGSGGPDGRRQESADGHELVFAVNYLSGYLLTRLLLANVSAAAPARIVNVSSIGQFPIDFDDVMLTRGFDGTRAYCQSKLAQILFTMDLAGRIEGSGVTVTCLHPSTYMDTTMVRAMGIKPINTVETGGEAVLNLAASSELAGASGLYFNVKREARANDQAYDPAARARLWSLSARLCGLPEELEI
jgi:NAD(P)-dependent dehydrogenase (short-subunit alcohol dehydrogenase family)